MYVKNFFLFQLNAHNMLNTYIYHLLPFICCGVSYTIFMETTALFAQELYALVLSSSYLVFLQLLINFVC